MISNTRSRQVSQTRKPSACGSRRLLPRSSWTRPDGDDAGFQYRELLEQVGVDEKRLFSLPKGWASEDLIDRKVFVEIVSTLLPIGKFLRVGDLQDGVPLVKALELWGKRNKTKIPGHVAIAYGLVNRARDLRLARGAKEALVKLHDGFTHAFEM